MWAANRQSGFTIVELLIVIIIIAILAAITIVGFNGVQGRANDAAVRSDLANIARQYELYKTDITISNDLYPYGATLSNGVAFTIGVSKGSYDLAASYQLLNCTKSASPGSDYAVLALTRSGKKLYVSSTSGGVQEYTGGNAWLPVTACADVLAGSTGNGAGYSGGVWRAWTH